MSLSSRFCRYIYSGIFRLEDQETSDILDLLCAADELIIDELIEYIQTYLIQNRSTWIVENLIKILNIIAPRAATFYIKNYCLEEITLLNPSTFFESECFFNMDEIVLVALLERDDLGMNESKLWNYVLRWGIVNTPSLNYILEDKNISITDNRDNNKVILYNGPQKITIHWKKVKNDCIPLIRFFHIPQTEFYKKVRPYSKILPEELLEEIINYHSSEVSSNYNIQLPRTCSIQIDSNLINSKQVAIIASWLDNNDKKYQLHIYLNYYLELQ
jgi:hypothetical protein